MSIYFSELVYLATFSQFYTTYADSHSNLGGRPGQLFAPSCLWPSLLWLSDKDKTLIYIHSRSKPNLHYSGRHNPPCGRRGLFGAVVDCGRRSLLQPSQVIGCGRHRRSPAPIQAYRAMTDHKNKEYKHIKQTHLTNQQNIAQITHGHFSIHICIFICGYSIVISQCIAVMS